MLCRVVLAHMTMIHPLVLFTNHDYVKKKTSIRKKIVNGDHSNETRVITYRLLTLISQYSWNKHTEWISICRCYHPILLWSLILLFLSVVLIFSLAAQLAIYLGSAFGVWDRGCCAIMLLITVVMFNIISCYVKAVWFTVLEIYREKC